MERNSKSPEKASSRLGRGLAALIPPQEKSPAPAGFSPPPVESPSPATPSREGVQEVPIAAITANPYQPRTAFAESALEELADSIRTHGILQPIMVRPRGGGRYELVAGERRFRAAERAGLTRVPAVVRSLTDEESLTVALIENIQREDLNPIEAARGYQQLMDQFGLTQTQLGQQIGKKQSTISNATRLLTLPPEMQESIADGLLTEAHGKALLSVSDPQRRREVWQDALALQWSVKETQAQANLAESLSPGKTKRTRSVRPQPVQDVHWEALMARVRAAFSLKVSVKANAHGGGRLILEFSSPEEIEGILDRLR